MKDLEKIAREWGKGAVNKDMYTDLCTYRGLVMISHDQESQPLLDLRSQYMKKYNVEEDTFLSHYVLVDEYLLPEITK